MNETLVTIVGNVATQPEFRRTASEVPVARFRLATTARRWDRTSGAWSDGHTSFYTVWAWRALAENVMASVGSGEPLVVQGRLRVREEEREGKKWTSAEIDAVAVGHDLSRGTSAFRRVSQGRPELTVRDAAWEPAREPAREPVREPVRDSAWESTRDSVRESPQPVAVSG